LNKLTLSLVAECRAGDAFRASKLNPACSRTSGAEVEGEEAEGSKLNAEVERSRNRSGKEILGFTTCQSHTTKN